MEGMSVGSVAKKLFGGGEQEDARKAAERQRELQKIANDRQLAQLNADEQRNSVSRKAPRGRRLLVSNADTGGLATTLGG